MPLDLLITGRIATLAGDEGFGWVEAIGIRDGRIAFAGTEVWLETRADPFTRRINLEPDEVAIPGLTDAHLHLVQAAIARRQVDLEAAPTLEEGLKRVACRARGAGRRPTPGWRDMAGTPTAGAAGRRPTSSRRSRPVGGWRCGPTTTTRCGRATPRCGPPGSRRGTRTRPAA